MRLLRILLLSAGGLGVVGFGALLAWSADTSPAEPSAYAAAMADTAVTVGSRGDFITIRPSDSEPAAGLLFYPGARIAPEAYVAKLSRVAKAAKIQVVIGRPRFHLAFLSLGQADEMRQALPSVTRWYVGGHSLGGAAACWYASKHRDELDGVVLLGTYCGSDLSNAALRVLSITGDHDGLFPPREIDAHRHELPAGATMVQIPGMNHAQFGSYGAQKGDAAAIIDDATASRAVVGAAATFFSSALPAER